MDIRLYALLVIHNRSGEKSPSAECLRKSGNAAVVMADNSTADYGNAAYCEAAGFTYLPMGGNAGLAKAYNKGIAAARSLGATHVLLLDDDTTLPDGFWEGTLAAIAAHPQDGIFLPQVYDEVGLLSPCAMRGLAAARVRSAQGLTLQDISGINSGMALSLSLFDDYAYDEGYFLDYIDHAFLRDMKARGVTICVTDQTLSQRFSDNERGDPAAAKARFAIFRRDFRRFCGTSLKGKLYASAVIARRRLKLWLRQ